MIKSHKLFLMHHGIPVPKGRDLHHIDGSHDNDDPSNWEVLTRAEHMRLHALGHVHCEEHKAKISAALKGRGRSTATKAKISASTMGRIGTRKGCILSAETRMKMSQAALGRIPSVETRAKLSLATKSWYKRQRCISK